MPPTWSICSWLCSSIFTSWGRNPRARMLLRIKSAPFSVPPSIRMCPAVPVIRIEEMPHVPTRYVLAWMRTGGAGLSQSSLSSQIASNSGPAISTGARGCSICLGGLPSGNVNTGDWAAASHNARLANIARAVHVDGRAGGRGRRFGREPADNLGDFGRAGDAAERDVGKDRSAAAAGQIFLGHLGNGEARRHGKGEDTVGGVGARNRLGHADERGLRRRIVPVLRAVPAPSRAARHVHDASAAVLAEVRDREPAQVSRRLNIDLK